MKWQITIIIVAVLLGLGISQIDFHTTQNQKNDQSQQNNQITQVTTVSINGLDYENMVWTNEMITRRDFQVKSYEPYQYNFMKIGYSHDAMFIAYPIIHKEVVITNATVNDQKVINTNNTEIKLNLFEKIFGVKK